MAVYGLDLIRTFRHVDENDPAKGTPDETVFFLKALDSNIMGHITDRLTSYQFSNDNGIPSTKMQLNAAAIMAARFSVDRWENFKVSEDGDALPCDKAIEHVAGSTYSALTPECVGSIPLEIVLGIYRVVRDHNELSKEEAKN